MQQRTTPSRRAGFTLAEMLIAVVIIMILMGIGAYAILRMRDTGPAQATIANLGKLKAVLDSQWKAVVDKARRDPLPSGVTRDQLINQRIKQAFPISFVEIYDPTKMPSIGVWQPYKQYLDGLGLGLNSTTAAQYPADVQQGICLQMILERGPSHADLSVDQLGTSLIQQIQTNPTNISGLTNKQVQAIVDGWSKPLLFSRNYKNAASTLGIVSMGANGKAGVQVDVSSSSNHNLVITSQVDADDNITIPD
ncbi:MAG: prepilin-type N-terminal cleavage/methylation domain-containing protein [Gemmataceae bacterium]